MNNDIPMDYGDAPTAQAGTFGLIPNGTLAKVRVSIKPQKDGGYVRKSKTFDETGNAYIEADLVITEGPYARKHVFTNIGIAGSEKYVQMGRAAIRAILEAGNNAGPHNMAGYKISDFGALTGLEVPVKIKVAKAEPNSGYEDKNEIAAWLSPNPESSTHKDYQRFLSGDLGAPAVAGPAPVVAGWAAPAPAPQAQPVTSAKPAWAR